MKSHEREAAVKGLKPRKPQENEMSWQERLCRRSIPTLLWTALVLNPIIFYPYGVNQFRLVKEVLCQIIIAIMFICCLIVMLERWGGETEETQNQAGRGVIGRLKKVMARAFRYVFRGPDLIRGPMLFLLLVGVLSTAFSTNRALSIRPLVNLFLFVILYFIINHHISRRHVEKFLVVILLTGMINGLYCVIQYLGWDPIFALTQSTAKGGRIASSGFIGNPNTVGGYLAAAIPLSLSALFFRRPAWMPVVGFFSLVAMGLGIGFSQTLTAAASAIFSVFVFFLALFLGPSVVKRRIMIAIAAVVVAMGIILGTTQPMKARLVRWKSYWNTNNWNVIVSNRPFIWWLTVKMIEDRPVLGGGLGTFSYRAFSYQAFMLPRLCTDSPLYPVTFPIFATPHNEYLMLGAEAGIPGMAAAGWLLVAVILLGWRSIRKFRKHRQARNLNRALAGGEVENMRHDYLLIIGFATSVLASAVESLTHFYFHIAPSALLAVTALGLWGVILHKNSGGNP